MSGYSRKKKMQEREKADYRILLSGIIIAIIPLVVQLVMRGNTLINYSWYSSKETEVDFFLRYKMYSLIIVMCVMLLVFVKDCFSYKNYLMSKCCKSDDKFVSVMFMSIIGFEVVALLSALFSDNKAAAFTGGYAQHEPFFVLLAYGVILLFTYCYINNKNTLMLLYKMFLIGVAFMSIVGLTQYFKNDFFASPIGRKIITVVSGIDPARVNMKFEPGRVYLSLYNPNYVGSYAALVLPVVAAGVIVLKKIWQKIAAGIISFMLILCLAGSLSTTGMTAILVSVVISVIVTMKNKKYILIAVSVLVATAGVVAVTNLDIVKQSIAKYALTPDNFIMNKMEITENGVEFEYNGNEFVVGCDAEAQVINLSDAEGQAVELVYDGQAGGFVTATDSRFAGIVFGNSVFEENRKGFYVSCAGTTFQFCKEAETGKYLFKNPYGKFTDDVVCSKALVFDKYERFASGRGFIWSRTIPLLGENILIGSGPDNFVYEFPNNDYLAMLNNTYYGQVVTRPHNMYLQIGVQTGVVSLVLFVLIYVLYFIQCIRVYSKKVAITPLRILGMSIMTGSLGYMICGLANDSTVGVAPIYFGLVGAGYACNLLVKKEEDKISNGESEQKK